MTEWRWGNSVTNGSPGGKRPKPRCNKWSYSGTLPERTVISLGTRGNNMTNLINFANETEGTKRRKAWKRHVDVIVQLVGHLKNRRNVNKETTKLVEKIRDSFDRIEDRSGGWRSGSMRLRMGMRIKPKRIWRSKH